MRVDTSEARLAAARALRSNQLRHFTVRRVDVEGDRQSIGLHLKTACPGRRGSLRAIACLTGGELTELHVATGRPQPHPT